MSRSIEFYLVDIFIAADKVKRYTNSFENAQMLMHSELEWDAVIRELEIIGEATKKLLRYNFIEDEYQTIVDFRNHIVHGYFGIDENIVWEVVTVLLDQYLDDLQHMVKKNSFDLTHAIKSAKSDYSYSAKTTEFLNILLSQTTCSGNR